MPNQPLGNNSISLPHIIPLLQNSFNRIPDSSVLPFLMANIVSEGPYVVRGNGVRLHAQTGREILDFSSNTVNCSLGQNDPWVKANLLAYLHSDMPSFLSTRLKSPIYCNYPARLVRIGIGKIKTPRINHRQCNGSDVTELALKAASMRRGKRSKVVSFTGGYHGQNLTAYIISEKQKHLQFLCEDMHTIFLPTPSHQSEEETPKLTENDRVILSNLAAIAQDVFALILEPIQMNNGVTCLSSSFIQELRVMCDKYDICLIYDEIQTGFGWLGTLTAAESYDVPPNILCLSKGVTAGYGPMALMIAEEKYSDIPYGSGEKTNGADIRSLVAANAVLDRLIGADDQSILVHVGSNLANELRTGLLYLVPEKAALLRDFLLRLKADCPTVVESTRQCRLIAGVQIRSDKGVNTVKGLVNKALDRGLFVRNTENWLIIKPPIIISRQEMEEGFSILKQLLSEIAHREE